MKAKMTHAQAVKQLETLLTRRLRLLARLDKEFGLLMARAEREIKRVQKVKHTELQTLNKQIKALEIFTR